MVQGERSPSDIALPGSVDRYRRGFPLRTSLDFWRAVSVDDQLFAQYRDLVLGYAPDVLQFEEPYLWYLVARLKRVGALQKTRVIFSSHNIESEMLRESQVTKGVINFLELADLRSLERAAARGSDLCLAVTSRDADQLVEFGATRVAFVPNGTFGFASANTSAASDLIGDKPFALFVSSAHEPNLVGLQALLRARRETNSSIHLVIAGTISRLLHSRRVFVGDDVSLLGFIDDDILGGLYQLASVVVLPKIAGGGSNLKTAEALYSRKAVVSTPKGLVGFEHFSGSEGVLVVEMGDLFARSINLAAAAGGKQYLAKTRSIEGLHWHQATDAAISAIESVLGSARYHTLAS